jgi:hypothetical protein
LYVFYFQPCSDNIIFLYILIFSSGKELNNIYRHSQNSFFSNFHHKHPFTQDLKSFRWWWITLRTTWLVDFFQCPEFTRTRKHNISETGYVSIFRWKKGDTYSVGSLPTPDEVSRSSFWNTVFSSFRILDDGQSPQTQWFWATCMWLLEVKKLICNSILQIRSFITYF